MNATMNRTNAITLAEEDMKQQGFKHGPCIQARTIGPEDSVLWEVEFAYDGLTVRSATTDPASIVLNVNLMSKEVQSAELM